MDQTGQTQFGSDPDGLIVDGLTQITQFTFTHVVDGWLVAVDAFRRSRSVHVPVDRDQPVDSFEFDRLIDVHHVRRSKINPD